MTLADTLVAGVGSPTESVSPNGSLNVGETWTYSYSYTVTQADIDTNGTVEDAIAGFINNTATADTAQTDPPQSDSVAVEVDQNPVLTIAKTPDTQTVNLGGTANFTLTVTNTGNVTLTFVTIVDPLATTVGPLSDTAGNGVDVLAPGDVETASASTSPVLSDFVNVATADSNQTDPPVSDDAFVDARPAISVTKTASPANMPSTGGDVTYTVVVTNLSGPGDPVTITSLVDNQFGNLNGQGTCTVPQTIPVGGSYTCTFTHTFPLQTLGFTTHTKWSRRRVATMRVIL